MNDIKELFDGTINEENIREYEYNEDFWKIILQYLKENALLKDSDIDDKSLVAYISSKIDLNDNLISILNNNSGIYWNESVQESIRRFFNNIKPSDEMEISLGEQKIIGAQIRNADAGNDFTVQENGEWVFPNINIDGKTYGEVRKNDKILSVLGDSGNLQYTRDKGTKKWLRLLMPKYIRNVEVEDLNRNFWVIGQVISVIDSYLFDEDGPYNKFFNDLLNEIAQLWENSLYLWATLSTISQKPAVTDLHIEVPYLGINSLYPYLKFDNFDSFQNWYGNESNNINRLKSYFSYLIELYTESNLVVMPRVRIGNYQKNYYSEEFYPGLLVFDRNIDTNFRFISFQNALCDFNLNSSSGNYLKERIGAIHENEDTYDYYFPFSDSPPNENKYYGLVRSVPEIDCVYEDGNIVCSNIKISLYDVAAEIIKETTGAAVAINTEPIATWQLQLIDDEKNLNGLQDGYKLTSVSNNISYVDLSQSNLDMKDILIKMGFYAGELISYFKKKGLNDEISYDPSKITLVRLDDDLQETDEVYHYDDFSTSNHNDIRTKLRSGNKYAIHIGDECGITEIGSMEFQYGTGLISISIPNSIKKIGANAFNGCSALVHVNIPETMTSIDVKAFYDCYALKSILTIPKSVSVIGEQAFYHCEALPSVIMPSYGVTEIGYGAFGYCKSLKDITIPASVKTFGTGVFVGCSNLETVTIGDGVPEICNGMFESCLSLRTIDIPNSVTAIGEYAFMACSSLQSIVIPGSVTKIGRQAFQSCSSLNSVTISYGVQEIEHKVFDYCTSLESIMIPHSVTKIGEDTFAHNSNLETITIQKFFGSISGAPWGAENAEIIWEPREENSIALTENENLEKTLVATIAEAKQFLDYNSDKNYNVTIGENIGITSVPPGSFQDCANLTSVVIPDSVTAIAAGAFSRCTALQNVDLGQGIVSIDGGAFYLCPFTEIRLPLSLQYLYSGAFASCTNLASITIPENVTYINSAAFNNCTSLLTITVQKAENSIENAPWGATNATVIWTE